MSEEKNTSPRRGLWERVRSGLTRTRDALAGKVGSLISYYRDMDDEFFEELTDVLISSDLGIKTSEEIVNRVRERVRKEKIGNSDEVTRLMREVIAEIMGGKTRWTLPSPCILTMVGVNGSGKTTTAGKLAASTKREGKNTILAAADTFRAAAAEQLTVWAERSDTPLIRHQEGADPAAVVFDAVTAFKARKADLLIVDTAGRLHNKKNLMVELEKIGRVIGREAPDTSNEVFLVVDATTGQNALNQARAFSEAAHITGIVLTKLDSTAKGGVAVAIASELGVPVRYAGYGEGLDDLMPFDAEAFAAGIL